MVQGVYVATCKNTQADSISNEYKAFLSKQKKQMKKKQNRNRRNDCSGKSQLDVWI